MPDADDDDVGPYASDSPMRHTRTVFGSLWWVLSSVAIVAALMGAQTWWLLLVAGAEMYVSLRRVVVQRMTADAVPTGHVRAESRSHAGVVAHAPSSGLRHFVSFRFTPTAPTDAIVARLLALDALRCVRAIHFGTNCSPEGKARGHTHAAIVTFKDAAARDEYLVDPDHVAFTEFVGPYVEEVFVFDFVD